MDENIREILTMMDVDPDNLNGTMIPRETLLNNTLYDVVKTKIPEIKKKFSSSYMTSLHTGAQTTQKWPLLNLVRQLLHTYHYTMKPIRKSDGYTPQGVKKYRRYFLVYNVQKPN